MIEEIIRDTFKTDNEWRIAILRLGNVAGAFEHGILGEVVTPLPKNIIPLSMQVASMQREAIELQKFAQTADQTVQRSFVHVLDVCDAISASILWLQQQTNVCEAFDIANEVTSIQSLLDTISAVTQVNIKTIEPSYATVTLDQIGSNSTKAQRVLNWKAQRSIHKMIEDEWNYYRNTIK